MAAGQNSGHFYMEKTSYALGEPIFVYFKVTNDGLRPETFFLGDPYSLHPSCSSFQIHVWSDKVHEQPKLSCGPRGISIGCGVSTVVLQSGDTHVEHILLNISNPVNVPGVYAIEVAHGGPYSEAFKDVLEVNSTLIFEVNQKAVDPKVFQPWVDQLHSTDPKKRLEAARTLASVAPQSLEDLLLAFAHDPWIRQYAPIALHRLNTPRSLAALRDIVAKSEPGTWEHDKSAQYLANDQCEGDF